MKQTLQISDHHISLKDISIFFKNDFELSLSPEAVTAIQESRSYLLNRISNTGESIYGINTGFGSLCDVVISQDQIEALQERLVRSHACGTGDKVPVEIARLMLLLKIKNLAFGFSGASLELINCMIGHYNAEITPVIFELGSLGASGDLVPLSHMSLALMGEANVIYQGEEVDCAQVLGDCGIEPIKLSAKEGLALINGTQFSLAYGIYGAYHASRLMTLYNLVASMSLEAYNCKAEPFDPSIQNIRIQKGQAYTAEKIRAYRAGSKILEEPKHNLQDPYSFRCIPQVHGASHDAITHVCEIMERELNSVTDNPNVFAAEDKIISGGNFHAQAIALPMDYLCIALAELGNISERRIYKLIHGDRDLPVYLTEEAGLNSGMMIVQYTAAAVVSQNKHLANPVSTDSIVSSRGQEDHVSMAANAGTKLYRVVQNAYRILGMELMIAAQALEYRSVEKSSETIQNFHQDYRSKVDRLTSDRVLHFDIERSISFLKNLDILYF